VLQSSGEVADLEQRCARWAGASQVEVVPPADTRTLTTRLRQAGSEGFGGVVVERPPDPAPLAGAVEEAGIPVVAVSLAYIADRSGPLDRACVRVIHGRGRGGFRWALRHLQARAAGPWQVWAYGDEPDQVGDLRVPASAPAPLAVVFHGGFWRDEWERDLMDAVAVDLTARGWITWNVEYRRANAGWRATLADADAVVAAIDTLPVDATRVILLGHSAGVQLALCAAGAHRQRLAAVFGLAPLTDLDTAARDGVGWGSVTDLLGHPDRHPQHYRLASPAAHLPLGVPQMFVHGLDDHHVPVTMTRRYAQAARDAGDHVEVVAIPGTDHFQIIDPAHASWTALVENLSAFR
jgi:acetyl esterase/lipase